MFRVEKVSGNSYSRTLICVLPLGSKADQFPGREDERRGPRFTNPHDNSTKPLGEKNMTSDTVCYSTTSQKDWSVTRY